MPRRPNDLNPKQQRFVAEFLVDLNATQAAKRVGYGSPKQAGARLMATPHVIKAIIAGMEKRNAKVGIDAEWVLRELHAVHQRAVQAIKPALHPKHRTQMHDDQGNALFTYDATAALRALELISRHVDVDAFAANRVKLDADQSLVDLLHAGRRRAGLDKDGNRRPVIDVTPRREHPVEEPPLVEPKPEQISAKEPEPKPERISAELYPGNPDWRPTPQAIPVAAPGQVLHDYDPFKGRL